jgi:hypothetical protein
VLSRAGKRATQLSFGVMQNKIQRSGDRSLDREHDYYRQPFDEIIDKEFHNYSFHSYPALVSRKLINQHRMWKPYNGGQFDEEQFELVEGLWDHEHCSICNYKIENGHSYWANENRVQILCDECYEHYKSA